MAIDPSAIIARIIELGELDDFLGILNLAAPSASARLNSAATPQQFRKLYLKLSLIIHPDRLGKAFPDATKAFQVLVRAFENLTSPELIEEVDSAPAGKSGQRGQPKKAAAISRSNDGCYRTRVCCPRCKEPWSEGTLDGNPDYFYNFMMTGLKQYTCSTCLCEFGCMTAIHRCPFCRRQFEYLPSEYHNKVKCSNVKCGKEFGFMMYHASDRAIKEVKAAVRAEQERQIKAREAKQRRAKRSGELDRSTQEAAFLMGLSDVCPRCGEDFAEVLSEEEQRLHLMECVDEAKHTAFAAKKSKASAKKEAQERKREAQQAVQTLAAWQMLGAQQEQLWLLDEVQLRAQAQQKNLDVTGDKDILIDRLVRHGRDKGEGEGDGAGSSGAAGPALLADVGSSGGARGRKRKADSTDLALVPSAQPTQSALVSRSSGGGLAGKEALPSDLDAYSAAQLRSMCAAQGLLGLVKKGSVKKDLVRLLQSEVFEIDSDDSG